MKTKTENDFGDVLQQNDDEFLKNLKISPRDEKEFGSLVLQTRGKLRGALDISSEVAKENIQKIRDGEKDDKSLEIWTAVRLRNLKREVERMRAFKNSAAILKTKIDGNQNYFSSSEKTIYSQIDLHRARILTGQVGDPEVENFVDAFLNFSDLSPENQKRAMQFANNILHGGGKNFWGSGAKIQQEIRKIEGKISAGKQKSEKKGVPDLENYFAQFEVAKYEKKKNDIFLRAALIQLSAEAKKKWDVPANEWGKLTAKKEEIVDLGLLRKLVDEKNLGRMQITPTNLAMVGLGIWGALTAIFNGVPAIVEMVQGEEDAFAPERLTNFFIGVGAIFGAKHVAQKKAAGIFAPDVVNNLHEFARKARIGDGCIFELIGRSQPGEAFHKDYEVLVGMVDWERARTKRNIFKKKFEEIREYWGDENKPELSREDFTDLLSQFRKPGIDEGKFAAAVGDLDGYRANSKGSPYHNKNWGELRFEFVESLLESKLPMDNLENMSTLWDGIEPERAIAPSFTGGTKVSQSQRFNSGSVQTSAKQSPPSQNPNLNTVQATTRRQNSPQNTPPVNQPSTQGVPGQGQGNQTNNSRGVSIGNITQPNNAKLIPTPPTQI